jgi:hypothetical protein
MPIHAPAPRVGIATTTGYLRFEGRAVAVIRGRDIKTPDLILGAAGAAMLIDSLLPWWGYDANGWHPTYIGFRSGFSIFFTLLMVMLIGGAAITRAWNGEGLTRVGFPVDRLSLVDPASSGGRLDRGQERYVSRPAHRSGTGQRCLLGNGGGRRSTPEPTATYSNRVAISLDFA